jgi:hypothetical protein
MPTFHQSGPELPQPRRQTAEQTTCQQRGGPGLPLSNTQHGAKAAVYWIVAARAESGSTAGQKGHAPLIVDLLNYRRDGSPFWNRPSLRPVHNAATPLWPFHVALPTAESSHQLGGPHWSTSRLLRCGDIGTAGARQFFAQPRQIVR